MMEAGSFTLKDISFHRMIKTSSIFISSFALLVKLSAISSGANLSSSLHYSIAVEMPPLLPIIVALKAALLINTTIRSGAAVLITRL